MPTVWLQDRLVAADDARVSVFDRAFRSGEGVFETMRGYGRFVFRLDEHLERARAGAEELGFQLSALDVLVQNVQAVVDDNTTEQAVAIRLVATPGEIDPVAPFGVNPSGASTTLAITVHPLALDPALWRDGIRLASIESPRPAAHLKAVSHLPALIARRQAQAQGAAEALLTDRGHVLEASSANLFLVANGELVTPAADGTILPGVTRAAVIEVADRLGLIVRERPVLTQELASADEVLLTSTTREVIPVVEVDGSTVGGGHPGQVTHRLLEGLRASVRAEAADAGIPVSADHWPGP